MKDRVSSYPKDWKTHCLEEAKALPIEKRQEFVDYVFKEHLCIGDAGKKADLNFDQYSGIMMMQIKDALYFETEVTA